MFKQWEFEYLIFVCLLLLTSQQCQRTFCRCYYFYFSPFYLSVAPTTKNILKFKSAETDSILWVGNFYRWVSTARSSNYSSVVNLNLLLIYLHNGPFSISASRYTTATLANKRTKCVSYSTRSHPHWAL